MESGPPHLSPVPGTEAVPHHHPHPGVPGMPMPPQMMPMTTPVGLQAIYQACRRLYADQPNPLQVTAVVKYWLGGPDPLDYISMYSNPGDPNRGIPAHWHYVSFGLSDLYGDGRVHEYTGPEGPSGFGFELTIRLKKETGETAPPTWPAALMQTLARYVFQSGEESNQNVLCAGDHVSWHNALDSSESRIQHMLMAEDPLLQSIMSPMGTINFIQIIGVTAEELQAAQRWNGPGILELLRNVPVAGGPWLLTDMRRGETIFEKDPQLQEVVERGIETEGSNLSGVSAKCSWEEMEESREEREESEETVRQRITPHESEQIKAELRRGLMGQHGSGAAGFGTGAGADFTDHVNHNTDRERKDSLSSSGSTEEVKPGELQRSQTMDAVHIKINKEAGTLLPLVMRGRLKHGRHFTFKDVSGNSAITFVSPRVMGAIADESHPYASRGPWLQVLIPEDFLEAVIKDLEELSSTEELVVPKQYRWREKGLTISILPDDW
ncbi:suppressor of fused homolog isoform X2 [Branchiostoma floridae]|uniref:Suppressor of fused homolog n=1 Tax=Branchiostoma floridae TaxID=7739 RepID=A0A9J7KZ56_BRAFL|nr:suppressor of fused homolog isoform X2 [Branchiostoma floridae]